jgi:hypothetical protein
MGPIELIPLRLVIKVEHIGHFGSSSAKISRVDKVLLVST